MYLEIESAEKYHIVFYIAFYNYGYSDSNWLSLSLHKVLTCSSRGVPITHWCRAALAGLFLECTAVREEVVGWASVWIER